MGQGVGGDEIRYTNWKRIMELFGDKKKNDILIVQRVNVDQKKCGEFIFLKERMMVVYMFYC